MTKPEFAKHFIVVSRFLVPELEKLLGQEFGTWSGAAAAVRGVLPNATCSPVGGPQSGVFVDGRPVGSIDVQDDRSYLAEAYRELPNFDQASEPLLVAAAFYQHAEQKRSETTRRAVAASEEADQAEYERVQASKLAARARQALLDVQSDD